MSVMTLAACAAEPQQEAGKDRGMLSNRISVKPMKQPEGWMKMICMERPRRHEIWFPPGSRPKGDECED